MAKGRKVKVVNGLGKFTGANTLVVEGENGPTTINFDNAIIAAGSRPIQLPFIPHEDPRVWDSTDALELKTVPERLLVMGGGIIGLEMGTVYHALGSQIDVVEMFDQVIPAADKDGESLHQTYQQAVQPDAGNQSDRGRSQRRRHLRHDGR